MNKMREKPTLSHALDMEHLEELRHEWYEEYSERLEGLVRDFVRDYGVRSGSTDTLLASEDQRDPAVKAAMILLDIGGE